MSELPSAVVTGAGSGLGRAIALALAGNGHRVHLVDIDAEAVHATHRLALPGTTVPHVADVSKREQIRAVVQEAASVSGRLDVMVNAAGVFDGYAGIDDTSSELWRRVLDINLGGAFNASSAAVEAMPEPGGGRIINIGSIGAARGVADGLAYAASKAGIEGMNRRLAIDVAARGITANVIAPGSFDTAIRETSQQILGDVHPGPRASRLAQEVKDWLIPARRSGQPQEIADAVLFLVSDKAAYITGQVITIDGGWTAQ